MIRVINFENRYQPEFKSLNMEWLEKYGLTETHDLEVLDDPAGKLIQQGGAVFLAMEDDKVIGTAGLAKSGEGEFELVKMSVAPAYRGQGISKILLEKCLGTARQQGAKRVTLYSNSQLSAALKLYESYGFRFITEFDSPLQTADIKMELAL